MGTLVLANAIYQTKCSFAVLSVLFMFFWMLPYDSRLFPVSTSSQEKSFFFEKLLHIVHGNGSFCFCFENESPWIYPISHGYNHQGLTELSPFTDTDIY